MIVHRFMSREEYIKLMTGQQLVNHSKHEGNRTKAVGFCFTQDDPDKAIHYLSGCVDTDVCLTFEFPAERLKPVKAIYRDYEHDDKLMTRPIIPYNYDDVPTMEKTEYCTTSYDISMCRVINVTTKYNVIPSRCDFEQVIQVIPGENYTKFQIELMSNPKYRRG